MKRQTVDPILARLFRHDVIQGAFKSRRHRAGLTETGWNDPVTGLIPTPLAPLEPTAVMMVRGTADTTRSYNGGPNIDGLLCRSAADDVAYWTAGNLCNLAFTSTATPYGLNIHFSNCAGTTEVVLIRVDGMPHLWPDAADGFGFHANVTVIDFLLRHSR